MDKLTLEVTLLSDTTFGRGDGIAGVVDQEVEHDSATGLPIIKGRTIKGLLVEECANLLYALKMAKSPAYPTLDEAADRLFGVPGSDLGGQAVLHIGTAVLPPELAAKVRAEIAAQRLTPRDVLDSLTAIRRQTAADSKLDIPKENSLRATRVILRDTVFQAPVLVREPLTAKEKALVAACAAALHRAGHSRNRGRGRISVRVVELPEQALADFAHLVKGSA